MQLDVARRTGEGGQLGEDLHEDVERLVALVDDLLTLARLDVEGSAGAPVAATAPLRVRPELERVALEAGTARALVEVLPGPDLDVVMGKGELERALANLVGNAVRYADHVRVSASRQGDWVAVVVEDNGPGIAPADRERVLERFARVDDGRDRDAGGAGLGLAIVRDLVHSRGGDLSLGQSDMGGLRVELLLPGVGIPDAAFLGDV
jgi:signal transduction histidine kinase